MRWLPRKPKPELNDGWVRAGKHGRAVLLDLKSPAAEAYRRDLVAMSLAAADAARATYQHRVATTGEL